MAEKNKLELVPLRETSVVKINPEDTTILIDTTSELNKGYHWLNVLLDEVIGERYKEEVEDNSGNSHTVTKYHPLMMSLIQERRKTLDQIYKLSGNEMRDEVKKEIGKLSAKAIFEASKNEGVRKKYIRQAKKIIEAEFYDDETNT